MQHGLEKHLQQMQEEQRKGLKDSVPALSLYDNHPGDLGSASLERELEAGLIVDCKGELRLIRQALKRIEAGSYGNCTLCGNPLSERRLLARPQAPYCTACQKKGERTGENAGSEPE